MNYEIIIVGGGASSLMLASLLPKNSTVIIESNPKLGAKILISGGGKCNITNANISSKFYIGNHTFIEHSLKSFNEKSLLKWLSQHNLIPQLRKDGQYFCKNSSKELLEIFIKESRNQKVLLNEKVVNIKKSSELFYVETSKRVLNAKYVIVASGGLSFPKIGASPIGYEIAKSFGHNIKKTLPGLVGFTVQREQFFFKELSGLSTEVKIKIGEEVCKGSLLFAHKGISGPAVLDASLYWEKGLIEIDFLPNFSFKNIRESKKQLTTLLPMPKRLTKAFLVQLELDDKAGNKLSSHYIDKLETLKHYTFAPAGTFGYSKAEVTKGGIDTNEIDSHTMQSKIVKGLFFTGEVLDVTGRLGGYNFQWAFSSAYICAKYLNGEINK